MSKSIRQFIDEVWASLTVKSRNVKTGPIATSTTSRNSCPTECAHHPVTGDRTCYAHTGYFTANHWDKVTRRERGTNWSAFCARLERLPVGSMFRHNVAGDLPKNSKGRVHRPALRRLAKAVRHLEAWTYSHFSPRYAANRAAFLEAKRLGFVVNLSATTPAQADEYADYGVGPVVCLLPHNAADRGHRTPAGRVITVCPAQTQDGMTCERCGLCAVGDRKAIVGFRAHGKSKKRLSAALAAFDC